MKILSEEQLKLMWDDVQKNGITLEDDPNSIVFRPKSGTTYNKQWERSAKQFFTIFQRCGILEQHNFKDI